MRRTLIGLVAMGALVLGACGDDDDSASGSSEDFCSTMQNLVQDASSDDADPAAAQETLNELEPPDEIAEAWDQYVPLITRGDDVDPNDPEAQAEFREQLEGASDAASEIDQYLREECGMSGGPSSPSGDDAETTTTEATTTEADG